MEFFLGAAEVEEAWHDDGEVCTGAGGACVEGFEAVDAGDEVEGVYEEGVVRGVVSFVGDEDDLHAGVEREEGAAAGLSGESGGECEVFRGVDLEGGEGVLLGFGFCPGADEVIVLAEGVAGGEEDGAVEVLEEVWAVLVAVGAEGGVAEAADGFDGSGGVEGLYRVLAEVFAHAAEEARGAEWGGGLEEGEVVFFWPGFCDLAHAVDEVFFVDFFAKEGDGVGAADGDNFFGVCGDAGLPAFEEGVGDGVEEERDAGELAEVFAWAAGGVGFGWDDGEHEGDLRFTIYDLRFTIYDLRFTIWDLGRMRACARSCEAIAEVGGKTYVVIS